MGLAGKNQKTGIIRQSDAFCCGGFVPRSKSHVAFLILVSLQALLVMILASYEIVQKDGTRADEYIAGLLIILGLFIVYTAFHGIIVVIISAILTLFYAWYRFLVEEERDFADLAGSDSTVDDIDAASVILITALNLLLLPVLVLTFLHWSLWKQSKMVPALAKNELLQTSVKLDVLLSLIFVVTTLFFFFSQSDMIFSALAFLLAFVWASLGHVSIRLEKRPLMLVHLLSCPLMPIYVIWKTFTLWNDEGESSDDVPYPQIYLTAMACVVVRFVTVGAAVSCLARFGIGLRDQVFDPEEDEETPLAKLKTMTMAAASNTIRGNRSNRSAPPATAEEGYNPSFSSSDSPAASTSAASNSIQQASPGSYSTSPAGSYSNSPGYSDESSEGTPSLSSS